MYFLIVDVVVRPEYQGKGIGSQIMDRLIGYVDSQTPVGGRSSVQLIAEKGKEEFYIQCGKVKTLTINHIANAPKQLEM